MKKFVKGSIAWTYFLIRKRYQEKRHKARWKDRKSNKRGIKRQYIRDVEIHKAAPFILHKAPNNFSFIDNTNEVLKYFNEAKEIFRRKENVNFDISDVSNLTPDTVALLVSSVNSNKFVRTGSSKGNAPKKESLRKLFTESGFGEYISKSNGFKKSQSGNLLHKEVAQKVVPTIAKEACIVGLNYVFGQSSPSPKLYEVYSPLYETLLESMANTHNHADLNKQGECRWWLYVYNDPVSKTTSFSFIDLGVGIFRSVYTKKYIEKILKASGLKKNIDLVDDLLAGKINSRIEKDRELRGKGIPQIVHHSKSPYFKSFYIITNDVKINLTKNERESLEFSFDGTFLHWELIKPQIWK